MSETNVTDSPSAPPVVACSDWLGCPFCGSQPIKHDNDGVWLECPNWKTCGEISTPIFKTLEEASKQWNTRHPNVALCESAGREKASASGEAQCAPSDSHQQVVGDTSNKLKI